MKEPLILSLLLAAMGLDCSQAATVAIGNFDGSSSLNNVTATASSEFPLAQFVIASAFDNNASSNWVANGNGTGSPGNVSPDAMVTLDLSSATLNGNGGRFSISTFSFTEWVSSPRDRVGTWQVALFLDDVQVASSSSMTGPGSVGGAGSFDFGGVIADEVRYTVLTRGDESQTGNAGAREFNLTGTLVPEPSAALLGCLGLLGLLRRRRNG